MPHIAEQLESLAPDAQQQGPTSVEMATELVGAVQAGFDYLCAQRDTRYAAAVLPLDKEQEQLQQEADCIAEAAHSLEALLPAKARVLQRESDELLLAGKHEEAQAQIREQREAEQAPIRMEQRQIGIAGRMADLEAQKKMARKAAAEDFRDACIELIRGCEIALASVLDKTRDSLNQLEAELNQTLYQAAQLTADERSGEWVTLNRMYRGRTR